MDKIFNFFIIIKNNWNYAIQAINKSYSDKHLLQANIELIRIQVINNEYEKLEAMRHFAFSCISDISERRAYIQNIPRKA